MVPLSNGCSTANWPIDNPVACQTPRSSSTHTRTSGRRSGSSGFRAEAGRQDTSDIVPSSVINRPQSVPRPESVANACNGPLQPRATPCRCGFLISNRYAFAGSRTMTAPAITWWTRHFRGGAEQVLEVRRWLEDLLPDCAARTDVLLLASELCTNAIVHSRSGEAGGQFSVDIDWAPALARVVVGDQGSAKTPAIAAGDAGQLGESGRGLLLVDDVADDWGTASRPNRRWVWA